MALIKNEIPILEYDTEKKAIIMPGHGWDYKFTKKAVMLFMEEEIDNYVSSHDCEVVGEFESITKKFPVYKIVHNGEKIVFCQAPLGGAAATHIMDQLEDLKMDAVTTRNDNINFRYNKDKWYKLH